ncbi:histidine kinase [Pedobacter sp. MC2016-14]|uniref:histidine kinase n=1 Tax=Pedobacter sp. MC2016-14 TaxID=2897327 RepID=UPI001E2A91DB|nr:histidine kinase [Pedobacter sp. MC2016-14]MCD0488214.1 histidine kinase [Pedobacter sp. MC2016-14]
MKAEIHNPKYLVAIAFTVILCITGTTFFILRLLDQRIAGVNEFTGANVYRQKVNVFRYEFNNMLKGQETAAALCSQLGDGPDRSNLQFTLSTLLLSDAKVKHAWYAIINGQDTSMVYISRKSQGFYKSTMPGYLAGWVKQQFLRSDTAKLNNQLLSVKDSLHWLTASKLVQKNGVKLLLGLDVNMKDLQHSFYGIDARGMSYVFIVDDRGFCLAHPNDQFIGKQLYRADKLSIIRQVRKETKIHNEHTLSAYLNLPVIRYYIPNFIEGLNWTMMVDIPELVVDEDVAPIRTYSLYMALIAVGIIVGLIWLYQKKWQKELLLRIEKQSLSLSAAQHQKDNALLQLDKLKEKVNPHFLFNSLSSLNALIAQNQDLAKSFVLKLSRVYRYVLEAPEDGLATVGDELRFVNEYFFLMKIRFGESLKSLQIEVDELRLKEKIPFMSLQTLVENAVKHNMLSKAKPLQITIESIGHEIIVTNNLQLRKDVKDSGKQGLTYLQSTYAHFGNRQMRYGIEGDFYRCHLPVLAN